MKIDRVIEKRFEELGRKAAQILENKQFGFHEGVKHFKVDSASFQGWATSVLNLLQRVFGEGSVHYHNFHDHYVRFKNCVPIFDDCVAIFQDCMAILQAAEEDYKGGYLFNVRALVKAEVLVDVLEQAEVLKNANYVDIACIMTGVALEIALKEICERRGITPGKFNRMNERLWKADVYNQAMWEQLKTWYTRRSEPVHGNLEQSTHQDADDMIKGVRIEVYQMT